MKQSGFSVVLVILSIIFVVGIVGVAYYLGTLKTSKPPIQDSVNSLQSVVPSVTPDPTLNWKTYTNKTYGYSFKYPQDWSLDASKAEPITVNKANTSPGTSWISITKDGYIFTFKYNLQLASEISPLAARTEEITIDNQKFLKVYNYSKASPPCLPGSVSGTDPKTGIVLQPRSACYSDFDQIYINNFSNQRGTVSPFVNINGKTSTIGLELPRLTNLVDKAFLPYNTIFDQILSTFKFTN